MTVLWWTLGLWALAALAIWLDYRFNYKMNPPRFEGSQASIPELTSFSQFCPPDPDPNPKVYVSPGEYKMYGDLAKSKPDTTSNATFPPWEEPEHEPDCPYCPDSPLDPYKALEAFQTEATKAKKSKKKSKKKKSKKKGKSRK